MDKVVEEYKDIFTSPTGVPLHCQVQHSIDLIISEPLPNGLIYRCSLLENEEIKFQIQELLQKREHLAKFFSSQKSNYVGAKERWDMVTLYQLQIP